MRSCKGNCNKYEAPPVAFNRYSIGQKRCSVCDIFLIWEGSYCPCCGTMLRLNARSRRFRPMIA